jgi:hypothetical protein
VHQDYGSSIAIGDMRKTTETFDIGGCWRQAQPFIGRVITNVQRITITLAQVRWTLRIRKDLLPLLKIKAFHFFDLLKQ